MLYLALALALVVPLFGVIMMETGEVSPFIDEPGSANGASIAYLVHLAAFFAAFWWVMRRPQARNLAGAHAVSRPRLDPSRLDAYAVVCAALFVALANLLLFAYGGINVLSLEVDKAEFRISLGPLGAVITLATKWLMPAMFAALVRACADLGWTTRRKLLTLVAGLSLCVFGAATGFKTTIVQMLLPTIILMSWRLSLRTTLALALLVLINIVGLALFFDQHDDLSVALDALWFRLTVLQSDLAWYTWEKVVTGQATPDYLKTFMPILGDGVLRLLTGADPARDYGAWASYYFGPAMTLFGGYSVEGMEAGVNNQATLFAEVLVIGGRYFFAAASLVFGTITGVIAARLRESIRQRDYAMAATISSFFSFTVLIWTLGNGFSSFFYLINIVGTLGTYLFLRWQLPPVRAERLPPP